MFVVDDVGFLYIDLGVWLVGCGEWIGEVVDSRGRNQGGLIARRWCSCVDGWDGGGLGREWELGVGRPWCSLVFTMYCLVGEGISLSGVEQSRDST